MCCKMKKVDFSGRKKLLLHLKGLVMTLRMLIYLKLKKVQNKVGIETLFIQIASLEKWK